ncbi:Sodium/calcium exchanger protein-domain-containing protein [Fimicolochytrium jonesii]|uniref:Sodium/calcium exchanger protein-domain-containing protein n=1 Tax=Fimicolochytrium jonesii TaxID=1396493 RepID=UPI0022FF3F87|nr:Sodium/calcium exchanger protein-domain-containing protein [Fimicolochytrium jonesii]KAI8824305.1 Sodium/calcium exchanger protein-domain-containing protein [Fimicolochytrium jonesii]
MPSSPRTHPIDMPQDVAEDGDTTLREISQAPPQAAHPLHHDHKAVEPPKARFHPVQAARIIYRSTSTMSRLANLLWPLAPIGIILRFVRPEWHIAIFVVNYLGMIPSGNWLAFASLEINEKLPNIVGATFETLMGAMVELILCILLLFQRQYTVAQDAILGSMFANLLLITGFCFFVGGVKYKHQDVAEFVTEISGAGLLASAFAIILPSQFSLAVMPAMGLGATEDLVLKVSRSAAVGLLISYGGFLIYQLKTHRTTFDAVLSAAEAKDTDREEEARRKRLSWAESLVLLLISLALVTACAVFLVGEIHHIVELGHVTEPFMGLILVPLVEKAAEHFTAIDEASDNQMDLALSHVLGATIQSALLVAPIVVIVGWIANHPMTLQFNGFASFALLLAVLVVGSFLSNGKTNWVEGMFLLLLYYIFAVAAWFYPNGAEVGISEGH